MDDRRKALTLKKKLDLVDRSTAGLKMRQAAWGSPTAFQCISCHDPSCVAPSDYPLLAEFRRFYGRGLREEQMSPPGPVLAEEGEDAAEDGRKGGWGARSDPDESDSDAELDAMMEALGDDDVERAERVAAVKRKDALVSAARAAGFGVHAPLRHDDDRGVAYLCSLARAVVHVCDATLPLSALIDLHLEDVSSRFPGTAFVCVRPGPVTGPSAVQRLLGTRVAGALVAMRAGVVVASASSLNQFGSGGAGAASSNAVLEASAVASWLANTNVLEATPQPHEWPRVPGASASNAMQARLCGPGEDEEDVEYYDCGRPDCRKTFRHDHVAAGLPAAFVEDAAE